MSRITINIEHGEVPTTVSQMRKRLAMVLSHLRGDQLVTFNFTARLPEYTPDPLRGIKVSHGELARPEND